MRIIFIITLFIACASTSKTQGQTRIEYLNGKPATRQQADSIIHARKEVFYQKALNRFEQYKKIENKDSIKWLNLSNGRFTEAPKWVFDFKNLRTLDLSYNKIRHLGKEIRNLDSLKSINLSNNDLS